MSKLSAKQLKIAGLIPLLIPIAFLLLFTIAETVGGDISGLGHLIQLAPLVALAIFAWKKPELGGKILVGIALLLAIIYLVSTIVFGFVYREEMEREGMGIIALIGSMLTMLLLFVPPIISGLLFIASARKGS
jgi:hypothetical protein